MGDLVPLDMSMDVLNVGLFNMPDSFGRFANSRVQSVLDRFPFAYDFNDFDDRHKILHILFGQYIPLVIQESVFGCAGIPAFSSGLGAPY